MFKFIHISRNSDRDAVAGQREMSKEVKPLKVRGVAISEVIAVIKR